MVENKWLKARRPRTNIEKREMDGIVPWAKSKGRRVEGQKEKDERVRRWDEEKYKLKVYPVMMLFA